MRTIRWSQLRWPEEEEDVEIEIGTVGVSQKNIDDATEAGGDPVFELIPVPAAKDEVPCYVLGPIISK